MRFLALFAVFLWAAPLHAQSPQPIPPATIPPAPADSARAPNAADSLSAPGAARADSTIVPNSTSAVDSAQAAADSANANKFQPHPALESLGHFHADWSVNYEAIPFRDVNEPVEPHGVATIGPLLRLLHGVRTRELSPLLGTESFALGGASSLSSTLLFDGRSISIPGTSGPHSEEVQLSEISSLGIVRGGAAALYGPDAASGAVLVAPRFPHHEELLARAAGEEGVDEYQRALREAFKPLELFARSEARRARPDLSSDSPRKMLPVVIK